MTPEQINDIFSAVRKLGRIEFWSGVVVGLSMGLVIAWAILRWHVS